MSDEKFIIEYRRVGGSVKVSAIDSATLTEVSIIAAPSLSKEEMSRLAINKLKYVMAKKLQE